MWSRIQDTEAVEKIFRIVSGKKCIVLGFGSYGSTQGKKLPSCLDELRRCHPAIHSKSQKQSLKVGRASVETVLAFRTLRTFIMKGQSQF